jgi:DNA repair exonuclease SbcCD ATPase subunit
MGIADTSLFKSQVFKFQEGITYVYGLNRTGRTREPNGNAAGKSMFFSRMVELLYDEPVVGTKKDKFKKGKSFIEFEKGDKTIKIMSSFAGKRENFTVWIDGQQSKYNTPTKARAALRTLFPPTKDDFDSYLYVDSRVPHPLVRGSSLERRRFFTSFFCLDRLDAERKLIAAELSKLNKSRAVRDELAERLAELKKQLLPKEKVLALKEQEARLAKEQEELTELNDRVQEVRLLLSFEQRAEKQIAQVRKLCDPLTEDSFRELLKKTEKLRADAESVLDAATLWEKSQEERRTYKKARDKLGVSEDETAEAFEEGYRIYKKAYPKYLQLKAQLEALPDYSFDRVEKPEGDAESLTAEKVQLQHSLDHAKEFKDGTCYACGQAVKVKDPKSIQKRLDSVVASLTQHRKYANYLERRKEQKESAGRKESLTKELNEVKALLRTHKRAYELYPDLSSLRRPLKAEKAIPLAEAQEKFDRLDRKYKVLEQNLVHLDTILALDKLTPPDRKMAKKDTGRLQTLQEELSSIQSKLAVHRSVVSNAKELKARLDTIDSELVDEESIKLLLKGYSDKAVRRMAIESISTRLMQNVNHYAQQVFAGYTFEFVWDTQISILVHRPNGETSDVRKLSGAESLLFTLILIPSLYAFVPSRKRSNVLILDEPSASLSEAGIQAFHELLPVLNKLIPSIVVITPKHAERMDGAQEFTVVRDRNGANIVPGHPSEVK